MQLLRQRGAPEARPHPEARLHAFRSFTAETDPPQASITSGPAQGSSTNDSTPSFSFASNEPGSTFVCRVDARPLQALQLAATRSPPLADGAHTFSVKAIDAPGNESPVVSRSFTVDTQPRRRPRSPTPTPTRRPTTTPPR